MDKSKAAVAERRQALIYSFVVGTLAFLICLGIRPDPVQPLNDPSRHIGSWWPLNLLACWGFALLLIVVSNFLESHTKQHEDDEITAAWWIKFGGPSLAAFLAPTAGITASALFSWTLGLLGAVLAGFMIYFFIVVAASTCFLMNKWKKFAEPRVMRLFGLLPDTNTGHAVSYIRAYLSASDVPEDSPEDNLAKHDDTVAHR